MVVKGAVLAATKPREVGKALKSVLGVLLGLTALKRLTPTVLVLCLPLLPCVELLMLPETG